MSCKSLLEEEGVTEGVEGADEEEEEVGWVDTWCELFGVWEGVVVVLLLLLLLLPRSLHRLFFFSVDIAGVMFWCLLLGLLKGVLGE